MRERNPLSHSSDYLIARLTALWALAESGLGGYMHAMKIPFTGIVLGGTAIVVISLIAWFSATPFKSILRATLLVMLVKFAVSPHTSPFAYIAVGFQGLMGALILSLPVTRVLSLPVFMLIAMLESALQKFILATLLFGKDLWIALDESATKMAGELGISQDWAGNFSLKMIAAYCMVYAVWAIILSIWAYRLPNQMERKKTNILERFKGNNSGEILPEKGKKRRAKKWIGLFFIFSFLALSFFIHYSQEQAAEKAIILLVRTVAVLLFYLYALAPLIKWLLARSSRSLKNKYALNQVLGELPELSKLMPAAWRLAKSAKRGWQRYPEFLLNVIVLSLYLHEQDPSL
ncbi:MAG: hypothetical protein ACYC1Q_09395 [Bacteroidia bacterium]